MGTAAIVSAVFGTIGVVQQQKGQKQQEKAAKKQAQAQAAFNAEQTRLAEIKAARERRNAFRLERRRRGEQIAGGVNDGIIDSSSFLTALGSSRTNLGSEIGFSQVLQTSGELSNFFQQEIANQQVKLNEGKANAALGATIFDNAQALGSFAAKGLDFASNIFSPAPVSGGSLLQSGVGRGAGAPVSSNARLPF